MPERDGVIAVWRVGTQGLVTGYLLAGVPVFAAVVCWLAFALRPDRGHLASAAQATVVALGFGLFSWCGVLRVRLELTAEVVVMVNPWGTQCLSWSRVRAVSLGVWGARFDTFDGFTFTARALGNFGEGRRQQNERFAELRRMAEARLADRSAP